LNNPANRQRIRHQRLHYLPGGGKYSGLDLSGGFDPRTDGDPTKSRTSIPRAVRLSWLENAYSHPLFVAVNSDPQSKSDW